MSKVPYSVVGGEVVPHYLTERDHPWLRSLLDEFQAFVGRPRRELEKHLRRCRFLQVAPAKGRAGLVMHVLFQLIGTKVAEACLGPETRLQLFELAAQRDPPELALAEVGERLGMRPQDVAGALFADLDEERLVQELPVGLHPGAVALAGNLAMAQALVRRATFAEVRVAQRSRALVRLIKLWGLLCEVKEFSKERGTVLKIRGALARIRKTTRYGYAIGRLLPLLPWCTEPGSAATPVDTHVTTAVEVEPGSVLRARCQLGNQEVWFRVRAGDPLPAAGEPRAFDSKVEEKFAKEFRRAAPHLELIREPEPIPIDGGFVFPDFRIRDPENPERSCLVEIIGFWTEEYLRKKLVNLRSLGSRSDEPWILCIDKQRSSVECDRLEDMRVIWYQQRIDPEQVLEAWLAAK